MRAIVSTDEPIGGWFRRPESQSVVINCIESLTERAIFTMTPDQHKECQEIACLGSNRLLGVYLEHIVSISARRSAVEDALIHKFPGTNDPEGVIPHGLAETTFKKICNSIATIQDSSGKRLPAEIAFEKTMGSHYRLATKLVVIDPYAAKNLYDSESSFGKLLRSKLLAARNLEIEIHTTIDHDFYPVDPSPERHDTAWFTNAKRDLSGKLCEIVRASEQRAAGISVILYRRKSGREGAEVFFPHDRHFEFVFQRSDGIGTVSDFYQLGNGVDVFADMESAHSKRPSEIYPSNINKMWMGFKEFERRKLYDSAMNMPADAFGDSALVGKEFRR